MNEPFSAEALEKLYGTPAPEAYYPGKIIPRPSISIRAHDTCRHIANAQQVDQMIAYASKRIVRAEARSENLRRALICSVIGNAGWLIWKLIR